MEAVIKSVFLLAFFLSIANALHCYQCEEKNSDTCEHTEIECPEGERCMTIFELYKKNETYHSILKGCSGDYPCDSKPYANVNDDLFLVTNIKCCDKDLCNDRLYEMPYFEEPEGPLCPICYEGDTLEECNGDEQIRCEGTDDKCISLAAEVELPDGATTTYSAKGCASVSICENTPDVLVGVKMLNGKIFECTDLSSEESDVFCDT